MISANCKCLTCKKKQFHPAGDYYSVIECGDDPYNYDYCAAGHWVDGGDMQPDINVDLWKDCPDYTEAKK